MQNEQSPPATSDVVGDRVRDIRRRLGLSVDDLVQRCAQAGSGLTKNGIYFIESGRRKDGRRTRMVTVDELITLADALGVPPAALLSGEDPVEPYRQLIAHAVHLMLPFIDVLDASQKTLERAHQELENLGKLADRLNAADEIKEPLNRLAEQIERRLPDVTLNQREWAGLAMTLARLVPEMDQALDTSRRLRQYWPESVI